MPRLFALLLCLCLCACCGRAHALPRTLEGLARINDKLLQTSVSYGAIPSLYRPQTIKAMEMDLSLEGNDPVFIVSFPTGVRIYPQRLMVWHMVVNEILDDVAYLVSYCPITGTLAAYYARMDGANLIFDAEGRLYDGNAVLIDRNTGSLWLQILGMAFEGPLTGRGLPLLPVYWTTWQAARTVYPDADVIVAPPGSRRSYSRDPYGSYLKKNTYYDNDLLIYPVSYQDKRLHKKAPVLGMERQEALLAVDIDYVKKKGAVNFFLGDMALLAVHDTSLNVVRIYNRQVWETPSLFVMDKGILIDIATRSHWNAATGKAIAGNMMGASMKQLFGIYSMWFAWFNIHPETFTIPGPSEVSDTLLQITPLDK